MKATTLVNDMYWAKINVLNRRKIYHHLSRETSDFRKTKVLSPTENNVKTEQILYFKYKNMFNNISKYSNGVVRSTFDIF